MSVVYGIDLGTTYTKCAFIHPETRQPVVLPLASPDDRSLSEHHATLRSAVALFSEGPSRHIATVGDGARAMIGTPGVRVIEESKAYIGTGNTEADGPPWDLESHRWSYMPQDIGAVLLRRVKQVADKLFPQWPMERVVITHPQRFEDPRREATRQAGAIAGLEVVGTLTEPDAAAISFGLENRPGRYLVFDIGGGTLDVTVARLESGRMNVLSSAGEHRGGRFYDVAVFKRMIETYAANMHGFDESLLDPDNQAVWLREAEEVKRTLCEKVARGERSPKVRRELVCVGKYYDGGRCDFVLDAESFAEMTRELDRDAVACARKALDEARLTWGEVDDVVMVGGSSLNPNLQRAIEQELGRKPHTRQNPSTAIARGAAHYAANLARPTAPRAATERGPTRAALSLDDLEMTSTLARGLGIRVYDPRSDRDIVVNLVPKNQSLPHTYERTFRTSTDGDTTIPIDLYEGEDPEVDSCTAIGACVLSGIPEGRARGHKVAIRIEIDHAAHKTITARDVSTGTETRSRIAYAEDQVVRDDDVDRRRAHVASLILRG